MAHSWSRLFANSGFRWQMGLSAGDVDSFFALTENSAEILAERRRCLDQSPADYVALLDPGRPLVHEMLEIPSIAGVLGPARDQSLESAARNLEPDFVLLLPTVKGPMVVGGVVCFPSSWSLPEKIGRTLHETHAPVPELNAQLGRRIEAALDRLPSAAAWQRDNWGLSRGGDRNHHPHKARPRLDETIEPNELWLRVERQLLYRLPRSGGILFGIRLEITPWHTLIQSEEAVVGLRRSLETMPDDIAAYKGLLSARRKILGWLSH